ncbi:hypothetical protein LENED_011312 [Lentinula edodes]|uniref:Uncharacterized protein n=1 Tax=Lentinula edodes TaxID=5353 RepID=A0A1Q3EPQ0_LENED|nr:hypothetical protein LENED_011312 [Lentinula edodes]
MYTLSAEPSTFVIHNFICSFAETNTPYITGHWLCYVDFHKCLHHFLSVHTDHASRWGCISFYYGFLPGD